MLSIKAGIILFLSDIVAFIVAYIASAMTSIYLSKNINFDLAYAITSYDNLSRLYTYMTLAACSLLIFYNRGHYDRRIPWWSQIRYILIVIILIMVIDGFFHFAIKHSFSRIWLVNTWALSFLFVITGRLIARAISLKLNCWNIPTIVIGSGDNLIEALYAISGEKFAGYKVKYIILLENYKTFDKSIIPAEYKSIEVIDGSKGYRDFVKSHLNCFYIFAPDTLKYLYKKNNIDLIASKSQGYSIVPPLKGVSLYGMVPQYFFGYDLMFLRPANKINSPLSKLFKGLLDYTASLFLIILLFPFTVILYLLVRKDGGPLFYCQPRLGKNGKSFNCWKIRTMRVDAEEKLKELLEKDPEARAVWATHRKLKNDPRVTKIGRILRKTSIDELPQLFNVLKGDMSLIGPRPILDDETIFFTKEQIELYYSVKPGITGLWQVSGRNDTTFKLRAHLDTWYVRNWSFWNDIVVAFKTVFTLFKRSGVS